MLKSLASLCLVLLFSISVMADSLYGSVKFKDKEKEKNKTEEKKKIVINTSWDYAKTAELDEKGNYKIDFGEKVGQKISVFINGNKYKEIEVNGDTRLDIIVP
ncbi:MAG: hypothetical protein HY819_05870 [Acidobacteria bacterium]|nr:hypothetical protein [Acidobacteriota bacterium]